MTSVVVRRRDFSLSEEQQQISEVFAALFERECPTTRVRDAEPLGFDAALWRVLTETGVVSMALPSRLGSINSMTKLSPINHSEAQRLSVLE